MGAANSSGATTQKQTGGRGADTAPRKVRLGIVGGNFALSFQFHEHPDCIVEAIADLRPECRKRLMETYGCSKSYDSLDELVRDPKIDAVAIFTDAPLHVQHAIQAMTHGKHVLCAVPAACMGSIEEAERLLGAVQRTGQTYMMAETSYYMQPTISARRFYQEGKFGELYACTAVYHHAGLEGLYFNDGERTWRHGIPPMLYPTHCTSMLIGVTGERLTEVSCLGWGDNDPILQDNAFNNPFWNETAQFKTDRGHSLHCEVWWKGAHHGTERAEWIGTEMSLYSPRPHASEAYIVRSEQGRTENDHGGYVRQLPRHEPYDQPQWWETEMLPEPLRHKSNHDGSHTFLTHEFIDAVAHDRTPAIDIYEALAYTVPGIIAHRSALRGGEWMRIPQFDPPAPKENTAEAGKEASE